MSGYRELQFVAMTIAIIAVSRMGWEFFVNDLESLAVRHADILLWQRCMSIFSLPFTDM